MHLEEVVLEGFKSYATRTTIAGWDREFNAITGLNGSGKSNILDAIVFVLGITNYSQVRANNLQDLIYKRGQAGITKASVTLVFDNSDAENSPIGYEQYKQVSVTRQVLMGGRNKYIINGRNALAQAVQNLFQSVQLNVNNPHFLIMQGRITKVLNMKPPEILGMIEEAAGTRMFEEKKEKALKTIAKKDSKVEEITSLLNEEIGPKLDKLRVEKRNYLDYQKIKTEMERLEKLVIAYEYKANKERLDHSEVQFAQMQQEKVAYELELEQLRSETKLLQQERDEIQRSREKDMGDGGRHRELEKVVKECTTQLVRMKTQCDLKAQSIADEEKNKAMLIEGKKETARSIAEKRKRHVQVEAAFVTLKAAYDEEAARVRKAEELLQTLSTGVSAQEGHENGYMEQIREAKAAITQAQTEKEQAKVSIVHVEKQLKEKSAQLERSKQESAAAITELDGKKGQLDRIEADMRKLNFNPEEQTALMEKKVALSRQVSDLRERIDVLSSQLSGVEFKYTNPSPSFDRSKVKGLVAQLTSLPKENLEFSTALEVCAGGRLYSVVVEDEDTGKQLLQNGQLKKRVTIIPLNKIDGFVASAEKVLIAKKLAPGKVDLALTLIGYDEEVAAAMKWVFGGTMICKDAEAAKMVTFDKTVRMRSVTLDGDLYNPAGMLEGGSKPAMSGILLRLQELQNLRREQQEIEKQHHAVVTQLEGLMNAGRKFKEFEKQLELTRHETRLLEDEIAKSAHAKLTRDIESLAAQLEEQQRVVHASTEKKEANQVLYKRLELEMAEFKNNRDGKLKDMQKTATEAKADLAKSTTLIKEKQREVQMLALELEQMESEAKSVDEQIAAVEQALVNLQAELEEKKSETEETMQFLEKSQMELEQERAKMREFNDELNDISKAIKSKQLHTEDITVSIQKLSHAIKEFQKGRGDAEAAVRNMEKNHPWIEDQRQHFGQQNTAYDFKSYNIDDCRKKLQHLTENHDKMRKTINTKVMNMIDSVEKKEAELKRMLRTVLNDKKKIEGTIASLDNYKRDALFKTWEKVNGDLGAIFGDFLDKCSAKLDPPEGQAVTDGLEVKVCLGGVWKHSLTELSGGQRSLVALSLILSLLQFKPAPMYILDEVDAALDLSHTQNIGTLLRTRFKGSQFIVVSLKEGMFNNANVLFRAKFRDGISIVERTENRKKASSQTPVPARSKAGGAAATGPANKKARVLGERNS